MIDDMLWAYFRVDHVEYALDGEIQSSKSSSLRLNYIYDSRILKTCLEILPGHLTWLSGHIISW
jgi:hypothetical protein